MGRKRSNEARSRYGSTRRSNFRPTLPIVAVVCDDAKTAIKYFAELNRRIKGVTIQIKPAPCDGASPDAVVSLAIEVAEELRRDASSEDKDFIWALIDLEAEPHRQAQANQAQLKAEGKGVRVAKSNPCFEVWTLAHLIDTGERFDHCTAVLDRIKREWKIAFGVEFAKKKAQADYSKLMERCEQAVIWAKQHFENEDPSWTEVYKVVEAIISQAS